MSGMRPWGLSVIQSARHAPMVSLGIHVDLHTPTLDIHLPGWTIQLGRNGWWGIIDQERRMLGGRVVYSPAPEWHGHTDNCDHDRPAISGRSKFGPR